MRESLKRVAETPTEELQHEAARASISNLVYDMEDKMEAHLVNLHDEVIAHVVEECVKANRHSVKSQTSEDRIPTWSSCRQLRHSRAGAGHCARVAPSRTEHN